MFLQSKSLASAPQFYTEFSRIYKPYLYSIERYISFFQRVNETPKSLECSPFLEIHGTSEAESSHIMITQGRGEKSFFVGGGISTKKSSRGLFSIMTSLRMGEVV
jgi:hypothetical protein